MLNRAATEYAEYLLTGKEDQENLEKICKSNHVICTVTSLVGFAILEEEEDH